MMAQWNNPDFSETIRQNWIGPGKRAVHRRRGQGSPIRSRVGASSGCAGNKVGSLKAKQVGKLQPTYQGATDNAENYGCGLLSDGRLLTSDIGNQADGRRNGQLIVWFPPFTKGFKTLPNGTEGKVPVLQARHRHRHRGRIAVDDQDNIYVASARGATPA